MEMSLGKSENKTYVPNGLRDRSKWIREGRKQIRPTTRGLGCCVWRGGWRQEKPGRRMGPSKPLAGECVLVAKDIAESLLAAAARASRGCQSIPKHWSNLCSYQERKKGKK